MVCGEGEFFMLWIFLCLLLPLFGTVMGAGTVFLIKERQMPPFFYGVTAGMMLSALWILLIPALEEGRFPAVFGVLLGCGSLYWVDHMTEKYPLTGRGKLLMLAITLHNLPEGMAVGIALAGALEGGSVLDLSETITMALAIAVQNFPDGVVAAAPLYEEKQSRIKAFLFGSLSGVVEPIAAILAFYVTRTLTVILPYVLSFAAGSMLYVVSEELIPTSQIGQTPHRATIALALGFSLMLFLEG